MYTIVTSAQCWLQHIQSQPDITITIGGKEDTIRTLL